MSNISKYTRFLGIAPIILAIIALIGIFFPLSIISITDPAGFRLGWFDLTLTSFGNVELTKQPFANLFLSIIPPVPDTTLFIILGIFMLTLIILIILMGIVQIIRKESIVPSIIVICISALIIVFLLIQYFGFNDLFLNFMRFAFLSFLNLFMIVFKVGDNTIIYYAVNQYTSEEMIGLSFYETTLEAGFYMILISVLLAIAFSITTIIIMKAVGKKPKAEKKPKKAEEPEKIEEPKKVEKLDEVTLKKVEQIVKVSDKVKLETMQKMLGLTEEDFLNNVYNWAEQFNFRIDGDLLVINPDTVDEFITMLNTKYSK